MAKADRKAYQAAYYAEHRADRKVANAAYHAAHRAEIRVASAAYRATHRTERRAYYVAHRAERRAAKAAYNAAHRVEIRAADAAYRQTQRGKETVRRKVRKRRALKAGNTPSERMLTGAQWDIILANAKGRCHWCGRRRKPTMDHVIPLCKGGLHTAENVVVACLKCNLKKHAKIVTLF